MISYVKCAWANIFTRLGYLFLIVGIALLFAGEFSSFAFPFLSWAFACLAGSMFGIETFIVYRRAQNHIEEWGGISKNFTKVALTGMYCTRAGLELAVREYARKKSKGEH